MEVDELYEMVRQMQTTNQMILRRLERISVETGEKSRPCECSCQLKEALTDIVTLSSRIQALEQRDAEKEALLRPTIEQLKELRVKVENLDLAIQTDDSKLKRTKEKEVTLTSVESDMSVRSTLNQPKTSIQTNVSADSKTGNDTKVMRCEEVHAVNSDGNSVQDAQAWVDTTSRAPDTEQENRKQVTFSQADTRTVTSVKQTATSKEAETRKKERTKTGTIVKPNFGAKPKTTSLEVEVIEQRETRSYFSTMEWELPAQRELQAAKETDVRHTDGVHDVIILDISASMATAWPQVRTFVTDFLRGLEELAFTLDMKKEHVALVTFGHETKVQQRLTNKFNTLRDAFSRLKVGGPSPISAGLLYGLTAAGSADSIACTVNNMHQGSRFILITDGEATDPFTYQGPDVLDPMRLEETRSHILMHAEKIQAVAGELCCVPVGKTNKDFFDLMTSLGNAKIIDYTKGRQLSRKVFLMLQPATLGMSYGLNLPHLSMEANLSEEDKRDMKMIAADEKKFRESRIQDRYADTDNEDLPKVGSRVRRGPDWEYNNQDSEGPGTVIGHCKGVDKVFVQWDANSYVDVYHYGDNSKYDILLVDEPRHLASGETIAVGCTVQPGPYWKPVEVLKPDSKGVVIKLELGPNNKPQATVRWENGKRGDYACDLTDEPEIQVCSDAHTEAQSQTLDQSAASWKQSAQFRNQSAPKPTKNKNKNKNLL